MKIRAVLLAATLLLAACSQAPAESMTASTPAPGAAFAGMEVLLTRSPTCGCCEGHAAYLRRHGMSVIEEARDDIATVKDLYEIPLEMRSCHTERMGRYFVEGHVPYAAIEQLFAQLPDIDGIALPGMPAGSPGMDGQLEGPLVVYAIKDGRVVGEFGSF